MKQIIKKIAIAGIMIGFLGAGAGKVSAQPLQYQTDRIYGSNRLETAIQVAERGWPNGAETVLIARQDTFPDALAAAPLAAELNAPILLSSTEKLEQPVQDEITKLKPNHIILLGSEGALSKTVFEEAQKLVQDPEQVTRINGTDRYDTARQIALRLTGNTQTSLPSQSPPQGEVILVNGENFPDALAVAPYAGITGIPILMTKADALAPNTQKALEELNPDRLYVIGSDAVVSDDVVKQTGISPDNVIRWGGTDRYKTAAKVYESTQDAFDADHAYLATGEAFPDAMTGGVLAAKEHAPLFLSANNSLPAVTYSTMGSIIKATDNPYRVFILGSAAGAVNSDVEDIINGTKQPSYLLGGITIVIDPGHGLPDPGAIGDAIPSKNLPVTYEMNNTLAISQKLVELLRSAGATVFMTRTGSMSPTGEDYAAISDLETRVNMANNLKADLFVSIHNNSYSGTNAYGIETYYSSTNTVTSAASIQLANAVQTQLVQTTGRFDRHVKSEGLYVLNHTTMPAVLAEVAFISNPEERVLLTTDSFRANAALGIYRGILVYEGY